MPPRGLRRGASGRGAAAWRVMRRRCLGRGGAVARCSSVSDTGEEARGFALEGVAAALEERPAVSGDGLEAIVEGGEDLGELVEADGQRGRGGVEDVEERVLAGGDTANGGVEGLEHEALYTGRRGRRRIRDAVTPGSNT